MTSRRNRDDRGGVGFWPVALFVIGVAVFLATGPKLGQIAPSIEATAPTTTTRTTTTRPADPSTHGAAFVGVDPETGIANPPPTTEQAAASICALQRFDFDWPCVMGR